MNFITLAFFIFLAVAALVYYILPRIARAAWLLCCSYVFYLYDPANAGYLVLLCAATLVTWGAGLVLERVQRPAARKAVLAVCVAVCIGSLGFYKYAGMVTQWLNGLWGLFGQKDAFTAPSFAVPLGISYFSFMALGYAIDVYRGKPAEHNVVHYALFVSFFPCIVTGPIERGEHILPQLASPAPFEYGRFCGGMFRILWGLFKKLVVADNIGVIVASVYGSVTQEAYTGPVFLLASVLFAYQLYCDFSACTDIAIGAGEMFGIRLMENFHRPLAAHSFTDLWRRWHISLTNWFRDYLYIPLGGNRKGLRRQIFNLFIVELLTGIWHGANWNFICWGLYYFVLLAAEKLFLLKHLQKGRVWPHLYTLFFVVVGWAMFVGNDPGVQFGLLFQKLFTPSAGVSALYFLRNYGVLLAVSFVCCTPLIEKIWDVLRRRSWSRVLTVGALLVVSTAYVVGSTNSPFLYFNF